MFVVVIDTNILVSSLLSKHGSPAKVMSLVLNGELLPCYDSRILSEYRAVLRRPKFGFPEPSVNALLEWIEYSGRSVVPEPVEEAFPDESDKKFYEVAKHCRAKLITGNQKHFPAAPWIMTAGEFLEQYHASSNREKSY